MANEIRERFRERKYSYNTKRKQDKEKYKNENFDNPIKIIVFSPLLLIGVIGKAIDKIKETPNKQNDFKSKKINDDKNIMIKRKNVKSNLNVNERAINKNELNSKHQTTTILQDKNLPSNQKITQDEYKFVFNKIDSNDLEEKIFLKFKKELEKIKNECEIIESEEYLITKYEDDYDLYIKAKEINKKISNLLERLERIGKNYKLIKEHNLIEEPLLLDNSILIDDIIAYKEKITEGKLKNIPNRIKLLSEYKFLYEKLDKLSEKTSEIKEISDDRVKELAKRNEKYRNAKNKIVNLKEIDDCCNLIIEKNNKYLEELSKKVSNIDVKTYAEKKLKGMDGFLLTSLRYIGLLTLTPLRGLLPSIGAKTAATRKLLHSMLDNMHYETTKKAVYSVSNYEQEINNKIYDVNSVEDNIELALQDVSRLKSEFKDCFLKYNLDEYEKAYKKIMMIEKNIKNSQEKVNIIKQRLIKNKEINRTTLVKVRKLNERN
ncbi:MAG: hypothetical protein BHW38_06560 [Firmicutes bacterium CAG:321_26_22]|nr:MAG: hypothetical protein BHW38_06560 [Firmicutes bacterium CAG:321_26_22]